MFAVVAGVWAVIFNDAGVGKDRAGVGGLDLLDRAGIAAGTVDYRSARIGDGADTLAAGVLSFVNLTAESHGLHAGMTAAEAVTLERGRPPQENREVAVDDLPAEHRYRCAVAGGTVDAVDSASQIDATMTGRVVVTGSHGGLPGGRAVRAPVAAAMFNDAGVGKDRAGIRRLEALDELGIAALTVDYRTARIGDARDTFESGVVSYVNVAGARYGVNPGDTVRGAAEQLLAMSSQRGQGAGPEVQTGT